MPNTPNPLFPQCGDSAPNVSIIRAEDGALVPISELWRDAPLVLVFLRHLGCVFCREHIAQLRKDAEAFRKQGANVALVLLADPETAKEYGAKIGLEAPFAFYTDKERTAFQAFSLRQFGWGELFSPQLLVRGIQVTMQGHFASRFTGDVRQLSGVFVIAPTGRVLYAHRHENAADNPPNSEILQALALGSEASLSRA